MHAPAFFETSDIRKKEDIIPYKTKSINFELFNYRLKDTNDRRINLGVIAQELEKTNPEFVDTNVDGYKSVNYTELLLAKVAEQEETIKSQEERIERLETMIELLMQNK